MAYINFNISKKGGIFVEFLVNELDIHIDHDITILAKCAGCGSTCEGTCQGTCSSGCGMGCGSK